MMPPWPLPSVTVVRPGEVVSLLHAKIDDAVVLSSTVEDEGKVSYLVAWWHNGTRTTATVDACEVGYTASRAPDLLTIGFNGTQVK